MAGLCSGAGDLSVGRRRGGRGPGLTWIGLIGRCWLLLDDNFGEIFIYFIVDGDDLLCDSNNSFEGLIKGNGFLIPILIRNGQHLEYLINLIFVVDRNEQFEGGETVVEHLQERRIAF